MCKKILSLVKANNGEDSKQTIYKSSMKTKMAISTYLTIITLNADGLSVPFKKKTGLLNVFFF